MRIDLPIKYLGRQATLTRWLPQMLESFRSNSVAATEAIAATVAARLQPAGDCIALHGDLGAGKTQFTRGLVKALGGDGSAVSSPTFVLLNIYQTPHGSVFHLDAYRLTGTDEMEAIGFDEFLHQPGVVVIEWAERVAGLLPANHLCVRITATGKRTRQIEVTRSLEIDDNASDG